MLKDFCAQGPALYRYRSDSERVYSLSLAMKLRSTPTVLIAWYWIAVQKLARIPVIVPGEPLIAVFQALQHSFLVLEAVARRPFLFLAEACL